MAEPGSPLRVLTALPASYAGWYAIPSSAAGLHSRPVRRPQSCRIVERQGSEQVGVHAIDALSHQRVAFDEKQHFRIVGERDLRPGFE